MDKPSPFFSNLSAVSCGRLYPKQAIHVCDYDFGPLEAAYDYDAIKPVLTRAAIEARPQSMWRYRELLPIDASRPRHTGRIHPAGKGSAARQSARHSRALG